VSSTSLQELNYVECIPEKEQKKMNQTEALKLAVEMLDRIAPGSNYNTREFYENLRCIKATIAPAEQTPASSPQTAIAQGEEYCEIGRKTINGRNLILMESCRDGGEAPAMIVDADTHEIVMEEVYNGFQDYCHEESLAS
jgi:hypothetical protein